MVHPGKKKKKIAGRSAVVESDLMVSATEGTWDMCKQISRSQALGQSIRCLAASCCIPYGFQLSWVITEVGI